MKKSEPISKKEKIIDEINVHLRQLFNCIGFYGIFLIAYSTGTYINKDYQWPFIEKYATQLGIFLTLFSVIIISFSIYFYSDKPMHKPRIFSRHVSAPITIILAISAIIFLFMHGTLPPNLVNGFALLALSGSWFRIQRLPSED